MKPPTDIPPARRAALAALAAALPDDKRPGRDVQAALDAELSAIPDPRDAALATELTYGTLRLGHRIQAVLARFLRDPAGLPPAARQVLMAAAYEILYLKVPTYASVNWAVDRLKAGPEARFAGLANAVLRKVGGLGNEAHERAFFGPGPDGAAAYFSVPRWIFDLWTRAYGEGPTTRMLTAQLLPPALGLSVDPAHPEAASLADELDRHPARLDRLGFGFAFPAGTALGPLDHHSAGPHPALERASFAGRQALYALGVTRWRGPVWDACAGRGGKTRILTELGLDVVATDPHRGRIQALRQRLPEVRAEVRSALDGPPDHLPGGHKFPTILLDAPCSGLGTLSRRPDIKFKRTPADLADLTRLQARLLDAAWSHLARRGRLAYLTCTMNPAENEAQIQAFLARHPDAQVETTSTTPAHSELGEFFFGATVTTK